VEVKVEGGILGWRRMEGKNEGIKWRIKKE
jgi:hypothetical protein